MKHFLKNAHFLLTPYFVDFSVNRSSKWALHFLAWCSITAAIPSTIHAFLPADAAKSLEVLSATLLDHSPDNSKDPAIIVGWPGLDLQLSGKIIWTSSNVKLRSPGRRSCIAKGRDENGPVELIIVEREGYYTATFRDGSGTRWSASESIEKPVVFKKILEKQSKTGSSVAFDPFQQLMDPLISLKTPLDEGGIASDACTDSENLTVLVVYTPCAARFLPGGLAQLASNIDHAESVTNQAFLDSGIDTPSDHRQIEVIAIQPTIYYPSQCGVLPVPPGNACPEGVLYSNCCFPHNDEGCDNDSCEFEVCVTRDNPQCCSVLWDQNCADLAKTFCGLCDIDPCTSSFYEDLIKLSNISDPLGGPVNQMRNYFRADLVVMIRLPDPIFPPTFGESFEFNSVGTCGVGAQAFTVIDVASLTDSFSFAREIGKVLGCCPTPGDVGYYCPISPWAYRNGHRFVGNDSILYGTITSNLPGQVIARFSNPDKFYEGQPTGTREPDAQGLWSDQARLIRETFNSVRCNRCSNLPPPTPLIDSGPVIAWGLNTSGQTTAPPDLGNCIQISAGKYYSAAIQETVVGSVVQAYGPVITWGAFTAPAPADLGYCKRISAGSTHLVAIKSRLSTDSGYASNNKVAVWGTGLGAVQPSGLGTCSEISAGGSHTLAIQKGSSVDGLVYAWGNNSAQQCAVPTALGTCIQVAAGLDHSAAITSGQLVKCWGNNSNGQCSSVVGNFTQIAAGDKLTVMLRQDGVVLAQGLNTNGQTTIPPTLGTCTAIAAGAAHTSAIKTSTNVPPSSSGQLVCWGAGLTPPPYSSPNFGQSIVPVNPGIYSVANGGYHTVAIVSQLSGTNCPCDLNNDQLRNGTDLTTLLSGWGTANGDCNGDGITNGLDISYLLSGWGTCP